MSALFAIATLLGCRPPPPAPPDPPVLIATFSGTPEALPTLAERGTRFDAARAQSTEPRPALASLLTGQLPTVHGLTDGSQHRLHTRTFLHALNAAGWTTAIEGAPLREDEDWGVGTGRRGSLRWVHGPDALEAAQQLLDAHPDATIFATGVPDPHAPPAEIARVPLVWIGPDSAPGGTDSHPVGHVDVPATLAAQLDLPYVGPGQPLWTARATVPVIHARAAHATGAPVEHYAFGPRGEPTRTETGPGPIDDTLVPYGPLLGDPLAQGSDNGTPLTWLDEARAALDAGLLSVATRHLERIERRHGRSAASDLLRARLLDHQGRPRAALALRRDRYERTPWDALGFAIARRHVALRDPGRARALLDALAERRPDDPTLLAERVRVAVLLGDDAGLESLLARLWILAPPLAEAEEIRIALRAGAPWGRPDGALAEDPVLAARQRWARGDPDALGALEAELSRHPRDIDLRVTVAQWALELGDADRAVRLLEPVARWVPDDLRIAALTERARAQLASQRAAIESLRRQWRGRP